MSALAIVLLASTVSAHTFLKCTHWTGEAGPESCNSTDNWPYYEPFSSINKGFLYTHSEPGMPLCSQGNKGSQELALGTQIPTVKVGESVRLVWANNAHSWISTYEGPQKNSQDNTGRFAYVWHAPNLDPDEKLFRTTPYAQFDWMNSRSRHFEYNKDFDIPESADKDHFGTGNLTFSDELETGVHTFIFAWRWGGGDENTPDPLFDHLTCFQYNVVNNKNKVATIKTSHAMPSPTWKPVWTHTAGQVFTPMTGLMQTLDAKPVTLTVDAAQGGATYTAFMRSASNFVGESQIPKPTSTKKVKTSATRTRATVQPSATTVNLENSNATAGNGFAFADTVPVRRHQLRKRRFH